MSRTENEKAAKLCYPAASFTKEIAELTKEPREERETHATYTKTSAQVN